MDNSITSKLDGLLKYGITTVPGFDKNIYIKYNGNLTPYSTKDFILFSTDYLIPDILVKVGILQEDKEKIKREILEKQIKLKQYLLNKNNITKFWRGSTFHFKKRWSRNKLFF